MNDRVQFSEQLLKTVFSEILVLEIAISNIASLLQRHCRKYITHHDNVIARTLIYF